MDDPVGDGRVSGQTLGFSGEDTGTAVARSGAGKGPGPVVARPIQDIVPPTMEIRPRSGGGLNLWELWEYRELIYFLGMRDVKVRYKQTLLGVAWAILQPLLLMVVFTIFFGRLAGISTGGGVSYSLFAYAGLLPWVFFATAIAAAGNSVIGSERLITKVYFPRLTIPIAAVIASLVDFIVGCGLLLVMMVFQGVQPGFELLLAPVIFGIIVVAALGVGLALAALNVAYRDFRYVIPFLVQLWMFATPSIYMQVDLSATTSSPATVASAVDGDGKQGEKPKAAVSRVDRGTGKTRWALVLNPMIVLIIAFRAAVLGGPIPWGALGGATVWAFVVCLASCLYFRRVEDGFADII